MRLRAWPGALSILFIAALSSCSDKIATPGTTTLKPQASLAVAAPRVVISQIYGGGGNAGATYKNDFIELFNPGTQAISLAHWSVQYASAAGTSWQVTALSDTIPAGGYYLVQEAVGGAGTTALPTPNATGTIPLAAGAGKVLLLDTTVVQSGSCPTGARIVDQVSFGVATDCGAHVTPAPSNTTAALRNNAGCAYTGDLSVDFTAGAPTPRNKSTATHTCTVIVLGPPAKVIVTPDSAVLVLNGTQQFSAAAFDSANHALSNITFDWASSAPLVVSVSTSGLVKGLQLGDALITATTNGVADTVKVHVDAPSTGDVVISQVYGGGGNAGATIKNDFIELFNRGSTPVNLNGWTLQYTSATGATWPNVHTLSGTIQPGRHFLAQEAAGNAGTVSLVPDATGSLSLGGTAGKVLLAQPNATVSGACPTGAGVIDHVGYGPTSNCSAEWGGTTDVLSSTLAAFRKNDGCINTGSVGNDFLVLPPNPRNTSFTLRSCSGGPVRQQSAATLVINELMGDPANAESPSWGEWFEVRNYGAQPIDLKNWLIISGGTSQPDHTISSSVIVPAGGYALLGRGNDITRNGGVSLDYNYFVGNATTIWLDDADFLMLVDADGARVDSVAWTSLPHGASKGLRDASMGHANVDAEAWGYPTTTFGEGDYGSPDAANGLLADTPPIVSLNHIAISRNTPADTLPAGFEAQIFGNLITPTNDTIKSATFTWSALTPSVATVDNHGIVHGLTAGTALFHVVANDSTRRNFSYAIVTPLASATAQYLNNTAFGDPVDADTTDDFIVRRPQYTTSYNFHKGTPNWVGYDLNATDIVPGKDRCNCFTFDPELPANFTHLTTADYTGAGSFAGYGIDRGHMVRSFDRTAGTLDNAVTYYLSNVVPQASDLNQGPWAILEDSLGNLASSENKEVYIYAGPAGSKGTVKNEGKITIPTHTWKVAVVMPRGAGIADVHDYRDVDVVAVVMPNIPGIKGVDWQTYRVTVDSVEKLTGYRLLSALPANIRVVAEGKTKPPVARVGGPYAGTEGAAVHFDGSASSDPENDALTYAWDFGDGTVGTGVTPTHAYADNGTYAVKLVVTDTVGAGSLVSSGAVTVTNAAPVVSAGADAGIRERESFTLNATFSDAGVSDAPWSYTINWGDGQGAQFTTTGTTATQGALSASHAYATAGTYTVHIDVADKDSASASSTLTVTVAPASMTPGGSNVEVQPIDPTTNKQTVALTFGDVTSGGATTVTSGTTGPDQSTFTNGAFRLGEPPLFYEIATTAQFSGSVNVCIDYTGTSFDQGTQPALMHYQNGAWVDVTTSVDLVAHKLCGSVTGFSPFAIVRRDRAPVASAGVGYNGNEGAAIAFNASASTDADGDALTFTWNFGDGTTGTGVTPSHVYALHGSYSVTLKVSDGVETTTTTVTVQVANVAPALGAISAPADAQAVGSSVVITASFTDAGTGDAHSATINWGDGTTSAATVSEANGAGSVRGTHVYAVSGVYTITVSVVDGAGASALTSYASVVTYDATNGFVTGGGWINSAAGACHFNAACATATGKAMLNVDAKYGPRATKPDGNTDFELKSGGFKFKVSSYDWLIVSGPGAQFKGAGTVNGAGDYQFLLTLNDGKVAGGGGVDRFRIKIWERATGVVVYDNQAGDSDAAPAKQALDGGSIVIHK